LILDKFFKDVDDATRWQLYERINKMKDTNSWFEYKDLIKANPKAKIYNFTFSDDSGDFWSMMEHSGIFQNLKHIEDSHH
jgi:hypothetical protein